MTNKWKKQQNLALGLATLIIPRLQPQGQGAQGPQIVPQAKGTSESHIQSWWGRAGDSNKLGSPGVSAKGVLGELSCAQLISATISGFLQALPVTAQNVCHSKSL